MWLQPTFEKEKAESLHQAALDLTYGEYFGKLNGLDGETVSPRANIRHSFSQGK